MDFLFYRMGDLKTTGLSKIIIWYGESVQFRKTTTHCLTSDLWRLVVHRSDGDVEEKAGDGSSVVVADGEDELHKQRLRPDVLHWRHEGHFQVVHCMLGEYV